jgi:hypothetical protein
MRVPQAYEVWWTELQLFSPWRQAPPAGVTVVEVPWNGTKPADSWPNPPATWHVSASSETGGWVEWRDTP